jgi:hypothetical protein
VPLTGITQLKKIRSVVRELPPIYSSRILAKDMGENCQNNLKDITPRFSYLGDEKLRGANTKNLARNELKNCDYLLGR